jgi:transcriptional repressor NrdR
MRCPYCNNIEDRVVDSRSSSEDTVIRRRRECLKCLRRFTTYEKIEDRPVIIIKKDGRREEFYRNKVLSGLRKACDKRSISIEKLENIVDRVEKELEKRNQKEMPSKLIGELIMRYLHKLDQVAYVRFASVYKEFKDIEEFKAALDKLLKKNSSD